MYFFTFLIIIFIRLMSVSLTRSDIEENLLFGSDTPIYIAKTNDSTVIYEKYSSLAADNVNSCHCKNDDPEIPSDYDQIVYPEILVVADFKTFQYHNFNVASVVRFVAALYNGHDLKFRQMTNPKVRLNIAGIVVITEEKALPFLIGRTVINQSLLDKASQYFANDAPENLYQAINYDLIDVIFHLRPISLNANNTEGYSYLNASCDRKKHWAVAITRSTGSFLESHITVKSLAYAFGATAVDKMGYTGDKPDFFEPSVIGDMRKFLKSPEANCLRNKPSVGKPYKKILPGKLLTRDQQCQIALANDKWVADKNISNCKTMNCVNFESKSVLSYGASPPEGSKCGEKHICLNRACVRDTEKGHVVG